MGSGFDEWGEDGSRCFRPFVPRPARIEHCFGFLDEAADSIRRFDRKLHEWSPESSAGCLRAWTP
jgi:hypothetical protein